jgi:hypothetical protein
MKAFNINRRIIFQIDLNPHYSWIFLFMNIIEGNPELVQLNFARLANRAGAT